MGREPGRMGCKPIEAIRVQSAVGMQHGAFGRGVNCVSF